MNFEIIDTDEKITCRICGGKYSVITSHLTQTHNITKNEYLEKYPDAPTVSKSYFNFFSNLHSGENNPGHKSKTTEEERKSRSPFSKSFVGYKNSENIEEDRQAFIEKISKDRSYTNRLSYWIDKGFSDEEAIIKLKERQTTFTLERCIRDHGEIEGINIYNDRQNKWLDSLSKNGNMKKGYSGVSQELFNEIMKYYNKSEIENVFYATKDGEFKLNKEKGGVWMYDFVDIKKKKIIEYHGDLYHANPEFYDKNDTPDPYKKNTTSEEIWNKDIKKLKIAENNGFQMLVVWDSEYNSHTNKIVQKCLDFLNIEKK